MFHKLFVSFRIFPLAPPPPLAFPRIGGRFQRTCRRIPTGLNLVSISIGPAAAKIYECRRRRSIRRPMERRRDAPSTIDTMSHENATFNMAEFMGVIDNVKQGLGSRCCQFYRIDIDVIESERWIHFLSSCGLAPLPPRSAAVAVTATCLINIFNRQPNLLRILNISKMNFVENILSYGLMANYCQI